MTEESMLSMVGQWLGEHSGEYIGKIISADRTESSRDEAPLTPDRSYLRLSLVDAGLSGDQGIPVVYSQVTARFNDQDTTFGWVTPPVSGPLTEAIPFTGGTVVLEVSILDLPRRASSQVAADSLVAYSALVRSPLSQAAPIAGQVAAGVRSLLSLGQATIRVGLRQVFDEAGLDGPRLRPCYLAVVKARHADLDAARLSVVDDRLSYTGEDQVRRPLDGHDYLLLRIQGLTEHVDWRLPEIDAPFRQALEYASLGEPADINAYQTMALAAAWRSPELSIPDRRRVVQAIKDEITATRAGARGATGDQLRDLPATMAARAMPLRKAAAQGALQAVEVFSSDPDVTDYHEPVVPESLPSTRFFRADLEDYDDLAPLRMGWQYTVAFSVATSDVGSLGAVPLLDEVLSAAHPDIDVFGLTVQLDSDDFEIYGQSQRPLQVPRADRSLGKARFDISPRHDGPCKLIASVHYKGNFIQQMELTILVGEGRAAVEVLARGRSPDSVAALEPRDISIVLEPASGGGFLCTAMGSVAGRTILPIKDNELDAAVNAVRQAMMHVIRLEHGDQTVFQEAIDIPAAAGEEALRALARAGARLFQQLFLHPMGGADAKVVGEWLRSYARKPGVRLTVQIVASQAPIPWALLYLGDAAEGAELSWDNFLGMRHVVEQLPLQTSLSTTDYEIPSEPSLTVSVNVNASIDADMGITLIAEHQQSWAEAAADRVGLDLVVRSTGREVVSALASPDTADRIVYFYCHATAGNPARRNPDEATIIMSEDDQVSLGDLNIDAPTEIQLAGNPLVYINACESAELSPLFYSGFVPYFMAKGARGVIGTECKTPVLFAIEWANEFFKRFLDGEAVGETVLNLRQGFLREHNNPLGLIYAIHCDADTRINPALSYAVARR